MKMVSNVPNIHLGIYKNYQNFHPLIFYGYSRLRRMGQMYPPPSGSNRDNKMAARSMCGLFRVKYGTALKVDLELGWGKYFLSRHVASMRSRLAAINIFQSVGLFGSNSVGG